MELKQILDSTNKLETTQPKTTTDEESQHHVMEPKKDDEWVRNMVFETNDGLFSTASFMMGVSVLTRDHVKAIIVLCGLVGTVVGTCIMAVGVFKSVSQRNGIANKVVHPLQTALAAALAFSAGAMIPLMAAVFMEGYVVRLGVVAGVMSLCLAVFGWLGALLGGASRFRAGLRVLLLGWVAMAIILGLIVLQW